MNRDELGLVRGTLDLFVLKTLSWGPRHGYAIARWIRERSGETLTVEDRALYLALHRLESRTWVESAWGLSDNKRRARYYQLTAKGRAQLRTQTGWWSRYADVVFAILNAEEGRAGA